MRYALIENNQVKDIFIKPEGFTIEECFSPEIVPLYIPCPNNISEGDFYDPDTQKFTESPNKKFPNYAEWIDSVTKKQFEVTKYRVSLTPTINSLPMNIGRLSEYKNALSSALTSSADIVEIDDRQFSVDDFELMINALKKYEEDKNAVEGTHILNINSFNNAVDIVAYDFTTGWPEKTISI